jgi:O-methyltransferase
MMIKTAVKRFVRGLGFKKKRTFPPDFDQASIDIINRVKPYTMTTVPRLYALIQAVRYVVNANVPGSIVECGVWRGGSMMAVVETLKSLGRFDRDLYLYDTYEGMTTPLDLDIDHKGVPASIEFDRTKRGNDRSEWCYASIDDVRHNLLSLGYDNQRLNFIQGKVEETIPESAPPRIALLRLDTDWYESTRHELIHLYPCLFTGGVLIIDDYGCWQGCRKAVDEYFGENGMSILLNRIDYTGRIAVKL